MPPEEHLTTSFAFQIGKLGQLATNRFAERIAPLGLRPRHCGVLALLRGADQPAQHTVASALGVSNSVVVNMLDELEALDAIRRVRQTADRRVQRIELTDHGRVLLRMAVRIAHKLDEEVLAPLDATQAAALRDALGTLASEHGLPGG